MQNSIKISRTGDFWIDIGLVSLWKILTSISSKNPITTANGLKVELPIQDDLYNDSKELGVILTLSPNALVFEFDDYKIINEELSRSLEFTKPYYLGKSKDGSRYGWQRLGRYFFKNLNPYSAFFVSPLATIDKRKGKWKTGVCEFCGTPDRHIKPVGSIEHPLVVVPNKFSSFYSNLSGDIKICNWCTFASKFAPLRLFYIMSGNSINTIALECNNLNDLLFVYNIFSRLFVQSDTYRNFPYLMRYVQYPLESFLDFLFVAITEMEKKQDLEDKNLIRSGLISKVHVIQASIGQGLSIDKYYVIPNMPKVFDFIPTYNWKSKTQKLHNSLIETAKSLISKRGNDIETIVREEFARRIFYNKDVSDLIEEFLITNMEKKSSTKYFESINIDKFITLYYNNQMAMDSTQLYISKQLGDLIGTLTAKYDNKSLLYNLRSIGNLASLLSFFNQVLVRYIDDDLKTGVKNLESLLDNIENSNWFTYKSLIGIFSVLKYTELISKNHEKMVNA